MDIEHRKNRVNSLKRRIDMIESAQLHTLQGEMLEIDTTQQTLQNLKEQLAAAERSLADGIRLAHRN